MISERLGRRQPKIWVRISNGICIRMDSVAGSIVNGRKSLVFCYGPVEYIGRVGKSKGGIVDGLDVL